MASFDVATLRALNDRSRYLEGLALAGDALPDDAEAERVLELSRLVHHLGAPQRSSRMLLRAYRRRRTDPYFRYGHVLERLNERGPFFAWETLRTLREVPDALASRVTYIRGWVAVALRDFHAARRHLDELAGAEAKLQADLRARLLQAQDRRAEALDAANEALAAAPSDASIIQLAVELLEELDQRAEAMTLLRHHEAESECGKLALLHAQLALERRDLDASRGALERAVARMPLAEPGVLKAFHGFRAELAYKQGNYAAAAEHARASEHPAAIHMAEMLDRKAPGAKRVELPVPFVTQHHNTCVPATLTALMRFHGIEADHVEVADAICYDGTKTHVERTWSERRGLVVREFTLTRETVIALIDRGVPMSVVTTHARAGHMMAVIGYDTRRDGLVLMDPGRTSTAEAVFDRWLAAFSPYGPRAAVALPKDKLHLVDGIELPEQGLYDLLHEVHSAVDRGDLDAANRACEELRSRQPGHRIQIWAERSLALATGDFDRVVALCRELAARYTEDFASRSMLAQAVMQTAPASKREAMLLELLPTAGQATPFVWELLAGHAIGDARQVAKSVSLARRVLRVMPLEAGAVHMLGAAAWSQGRWEEGIDLLGLAAGMAETDERVARAYFMAAASRGGTHAALDRLELRATRALPRSAAPATTHADQLFAIGRSDLAFEVIVRTLAARPDDDALLGYAVERYASVGKLAPARRLFRRLASSRAGTPVEVARASLTEASGDLEGATRAWNAVASLDLAKKPRAELEVCRLAFRARGWRAGAEELRSLLKTTPARADLVHAPGWALLSPAEREAHARCVLADDPTDAEMLRELALARSYAWDHAEARASADTARAIDPTDARYRVASARVAAAAGDTAGAGAYAWEALGFAIDASEAIAAWNDAQITHAATVEGASRVARAASERSVDGSAVFAWFEVALGSMHREDVRAVARRLHEERPDLWTTWIVLASCEIDLDDAARGRTLLDEATKRFAGVPGFRRTEAQQRRRLGDTAGERAALRAAWRAHPKEQSVLALVACLHRNSRSQAARRLLTTSLLRSPDSPSLLHALADSDAARGEVELALALLERALVFNPEPTSTIERMLAYESEPTKRRCLAAVEQLVATRPWDSAAWVSAARVARIASLWDRAIEASHTALRADPTSHAARDGLLLGLAGAERWPDVFAACDPRALGPIVASGIPGVRLRLVQLLAQHDRMQEARMQLQDLVRQWPSYLPALRLALRLEGGDRVAERQLLGRLVRYEPDEPSSWVMLGQLDLRSSEPEKAKKHFARALRLAPDDVDALAGAVEARLALRDHKKARRACDKLAEVAPQRAASFQVRLALAADDDAELARALARMAEADAFSVAELDELLESYGRFRNVADRLDQTALDPKSCEEFLQCWSGRRLGLGRSPWSYVWRLRRASPERAATALGAMFEAAGPSSRLDPWWWLVLLYPLLRHHNATWAGALLFTLNRGRFWLGVLIATGWRRRREIEPWMVFNVAVAWLGLGFFQRPLSIYRIALAELKDARMLRARAALLTACVAEPQEALAILEGPIAADDLEIAEVARHVAEVRASPGSFNPSNAVRVVATTEHRLRNERKLTRELVVLFERARREVTRPWSAARTRLAAWEEAFHFMTAGSFRRILTIGLCCALLFGLFFLYMVYIDPHVPKDGRRR